MRPLPGPIVWLAKLVAAVAATPPLVVLALIARREARRRHANGARPRLVWGPQGIIAIKYWSQAMRALGYESTTLAAEIFAINRREDFDRLRAEFGPRNLAFEPFRDYLVLAWVLRNADIIFCFFSGGFLRNTALRNREAWLLRLAGKAMVVSPYGSDVAVPGYLGPYEDAMAVDYPGLVARGDETRARVDWFARHADVIVRNLQPGYLPRWDVLWPTQVAVDTDRFSPSDSARMGDGTNGPVVVLHAPNHRALKGTEEVIRSVDLLRAEGLDVRLLLLEGRPNTEVREALRSADVLAEQFLAGYGLLAIEGMASGTPVMSRLDWMPDDMLRHPAIRESPIVNTSLETLTDQLRDLVTDPKRRATLGRACREHALRWHSLPAIGSTWAAIADAVWLGQKPSRDAQPISIDDAAG